MKSLFRAGAIRRLALGLLALACTPASALYFIWDTVTLPAGTGASCGNGTPYRFFVNTTPFSDHWVLFFEGGGACWDQDACLGKGKLSATNPDGVGTFYMTDFNSTAGGLISPFAARLHPTDVRTQHWNMVYLPYCTGDVHSGNQLSVYTDTDPAHPRVQFHRGRVNVRAAAQYLRKEYGRPQQLLITGFSAGGVGATTMYSTVRDILDPKSKASLLADSGPLFPAPRGASPAQAPSLPMHNRIRAAWGLDKPDGQVTQLSALPGFDADDLGTVSTALALRYPQDRFGYMMFRADGTFSAFSYEKFYPEIGSEKDDTRKRALIHQRWTQDIAQLRPRLDAQANIDYYMPYWRALADSHCLTIVDFSSTGIEERGLKDVSVFIDRTMDRGAPLRAFETDTVSDYSRPGSWTTQIVDFMRNLFDGG